MKHNNGISFHFYSVLKNEDAPPFVGSGWAAVADGLGGSGSSVHELTAEERAKLREELRGIVLKGYESEADAAFGRYFSALTECMVDDKPDTSALWASRIVMARFAYAVFRTKGNICDFSDEVARGKFAAYLREGLTETAKSARLSRGELAGQRLLPTTFAAAHWREEEGRVRAEVIWAGDSRCYALTREGLRLLTSDDEDESGCITNLFSADGAPARLHRRAYTFDAPCAFLAVSDGIFDPYAGRDHFSVEYLLLDAIGRSESAGETAKRLRAHYDRVRGDDATMALAVAGCASFAQWKESLRERTETIARIYRSFAEMSVRAEVLHEDEEEVTDYIRTRTRDKFVSVVETLAQEYLGGKDDPACSERVRVALCRAAEEEQKSREEKRSMIAREQSAKVRSVLLASPALLKSAFVRGDEADKTAKRLKFAALSALGKEEQAAKLLKKSQEEYREEKNREAAALGKAYATIDALHEWYRANRASADPKERARAVKYADEAHKLLLALQAAERGEPCSADECPRGKGAVKEYAVCAERRKAAFRRLQKAEKNFMKKRKKCQSAIASAVQRYEEALAAGSPAHIFSDAFCAEHGVAGKVAENVDLLSVARAAYAELKADLAGVSAEIVSALAQRYGEPSAIDGVYNPGKLRRFRLYFEVKAGPKEEIERFCAEFSALQAEYESLLN